MGLGISVLPLALGLLVDNDSRRANVAQSPGSGAYACLSSRSPSPGPETGYGRQPPPMAQPGPQRPSRSNAYGCPPYSAGLGATHFAMRGRQPPYG